MKFTEEQLKNFNQEILPLTERELSLIVDWITANLKPEEVFCDEQLNAWAKTRFFYTKIQNPESWAPDEDRLKKLTTQRDELLEAAQTCLKDLSRLSGKGKSTAERMIYIILTDAIAKVGDREKK